jgi:hypothetical protein
MNSSTIRVKLDIQDLMLKVGIDKPHKLWLVFGGSKSTPGTLWEGSVTGIQFNSLERILRIVRDNNPDDFERVMSHLNASGIFKVTLEDAHKTEKVPKAKKKGK